MPTSFSSSSRTSAEATARSEASSSDSASDDSPHILRRLVIAQAAAKPRDGSRVAARRRGGRRRPAGGVRLGAHRHRRAIHESSAPVGSSFPSRSLRGPSSSPPPPLPRRPHCAVHAPGTCPRPRLLQPDLGGGDQRGYPARAKTPPTSDHEVAPLELFSSRNLWRLRRRRPEIGEAVAPSDAWSHSGSSLRPKGSRPGPSDSSRIASGTRVGPSRRLGGSRRRAPRRRRLRLGERPENHADEIAGGGDADVPCRQGGVKQGQVDAVGPDPTRGRARSHNAGAQGRERDEAGVAGGSLRAGRRKLRMSTERRLGAIGKHEHLHPSVSVPDAEQTVQGCGAHDRTVRRVRARQHLRARSECGTRTDVAEKMFAFRVLPESAARRAPQLHGARGLAGDDLPGVGVRGDADARAESGRGAAPPPRTSPRPRPTPRGRRRPWKPRPAARAGGERARCRAARRAPGAVVPPATPTLVVAASISTESPRSLRGSRRRRRSGPRPARRRPLPTTTSSSSRSGRRVSARVPSASAAHATPEATGAMAVTAARRADETGSIDAAPPHWQATSVSQTETSPAFVPVQSNALDSSAAIAVTSPKHAPAHESGFANESDALFEGAAARRDRGVHGAARLQKQIKCTQRFGAVAAPPELGTVNARRAHHAYVPAHDPVRRAAAKQPPGLIRAGAQLPRACRAERSSRTSRLFFSRKSRCSLRRRRLFRPRPARPPRRSGSTAAPPAPRDPNAARRTCSPSRRTERRARLLRARELAVHLHARERRRPRTESTPTARRLSCVCTCGSSAACTASASASAMFTATAAPSTTAHFSRCETAARAPRSSSCVASRHAAKMPERSAAPLLEPIASVLADARGIDTTPCAPVRVVGRAPGAPRLASGEATAEMSERPAPWLEPRRSSVYGSGAAIAALTAAARCRRRASSDASSSTAPPAAAESPPARRSALCGTGRCARASGEI